MMVKEKQYAISVLGLANQIRRVFNCSTNNNGVQTHILYFVLKNYPERDIYQKDIEEELNVRSASISTLLKKLEEQEMIVRKKVPQDDRLKKICPTSSSMGMKKKVDEDIHLLETRLTSGICKEDLKVFFKVVQKMTENMSTEGGFL